MTEKLVVAFNQESPARVLVDHLVSQGIPARMITQSSEHPYAVAVPASHVDGRLQALLEGFLQNPGDPRFQRAAWEHGEAVSDTSLGQIASAFPAARWRDMPLMWAVLIVCLGVYLGFYLGAYEWLRNQLDIRPVAVLMENQQWWRLLTPAFVHFSAIHLIFNLMWWWSLGGQIERKLGHSVLLVLLLFTGISSNLAQLWTSGSTNFGGLSGVVYGVLGFVWWLGWLRPSWGLALPKAIVGLMLVWMLLGFADLLWVRMANGAHLMGLVSGCLAAWLFSRLSARAD
ncbi:rhomboid family intramembrane serine protease GlpG [Aestuariibacter halophilus]|uniref:Rhomboid family intramembrane serine protease GlpG n=1 Tax=Fluctibacter halophilus TaxID=226011 RepID=A0ABS8GAR1_9ALTE|nr:rhomboid family intramembrane serine protease GlpG [Aestuariibacter halophilus]MCC2617524.1 rhomboid family intramembrane serine protease GlpG [Aestuariibacter halophilus]